MSISIAMVALKKGAKVSAQGIQREWTKCWPTTPAPVNPKKGDGTLSFRAGDADVIYGLMPAPIPWGDLEGLCKASWLWPQATEQLRNHNSHVIVTVSAEGDTIERLKTLTQATSAMVATCGEPAGVFWCDSQLVMSPQMFCDFARKLLPGGLPLYIWVDFRAGPKDGTTAGFTKGLSRLGHMELETLSSPEPPGELRQRLFGLAYYVLENGPVIKDGDTIGEDENERIKVTYTDSAFGAEGRVMRLDYGEAAEGKKHSRMTLYGFLHLVATILLTMSCSGLMFYLLGNWITSVVLRALILVLPTLIGGFLLLMISDKFLQSKFGWEAFEEK